MAVKKLIQGQPKLNDSSQYNFDDNETNFDYENSIGLPKNNDKFQNKDLYTKSISSDVNNAIIERNLKSEESSFIKIDKIYIENTNVGDNVHGNRVRCYMFSQEYSGNLDDMNYNEIANVISKAIYDPLNSTADEDEVDAASDRFFKDSPSDKSEGSDIGTIINDEIIIQNLKSDSIEIEDFPNNTDVYKPNLMFPLRETDGEIIDNLNTSIIDETTYNPIYIVVWMRGNRDQFLGGDSPRRKKYQIFKINNLDLFSFDRAGNAFGKTTSFTEDDVFNKEVQEDLPSRDKSAWRVRDFRITISTNRGAENNWDGTVDEASADEKAYAKYFSDVQQSINISPIELDTYGLLNLTPNMQLNNGDSPGRDYTDLFPDYFPQTTIKVLNENNEMQDEDLQSYYDDNETLSIKASAPATIAVDLNPIDLVNEESIGINYFYFVIDWDDATDEIKTLDDWNEIRPTDEFELLELQNQNLYKLKTNVESIDDYTIQYKIIFPIEKIMPQPQTDNFIDNDGDYYTAVQHSNTGENRLPYVGFPIDITGTLDNNGQYNLANPPYTTSPPPNPQNVLLKGTLNAQEEPGGIATSLREQTFNSNVTFDNTIPMNTYTTPGIKTIKMVMFSYDGDTNQVGRWKLITSRFYLDIPINQYPDFAEVGGSDYTTIPWPYTTPVIGGVDNNSKYKKSVQEALSSGKIGDADIIDEKFLINDLENDELGKSINEMDLEQCRYFNKSYDINELLNINAVQTIEGDSFYLDSDYLSSLPFPQYFEEFNVTGTGTLSNEDVNIWTNTYGRPDIANEVSNILSQIEQWNNLPDQTFVGTVRLTTVDGDDGIYGSTYWDGVLGTCTPSDFNNPNGEWTGLYGSVDNTYNLGYTPSTFDAVDAADVYFPEYCSNRGCVVERHEECDSGYNAGDFLAYNVNVPKPPIEDILPPNYPEGEPVLGDNIITNGDFSTLTFDEDFQPYYLSEWTIFDGGIGSVEYYAGGIRFQVLSTYRLQSASQDVLTPGKTYVFTYDVISIQSTDDGDNNLHLEVGGADIEIPNTKPGLASSIGNTLTFVAEGTNFIIKGGGTNIDVTLDNIMVQEFSPPELSIDFEQYYNEEYFNSSTQLYTPYNDSFWDGDMNKFPMESSVGQIFISDNQDLDLKQSCKLELNTGELTGKSIYDSSGNSNKGLLIGDYKVKKVRRGEPMRRDSFIKIPKKANNNNGAL